MALRCTVLGHAWNDPQVEREREESGSEVVTTVREFKECGRCGERTVMSENVEVTARASQDDDGAVIEDAETGERTVVGDAEADAPEPADHDGDDDAVILEGSRTDSDRDYGEWPEQEDGEDGPGDAGDWPEHEVDKQRSGGGDGTAPAAGTAGEAAAAGGGPADPEASDADAESTADDGTERIEGGPDDPSESAGDDEAAVDGESMVADGEEDEVEVITGGSSGGDAAGPDTSAGAPEATGGGSESRSVDIHAGSAPERSGSDDPVDPAEVLSEAAEDQASDDGPIEPTVTADVDMEVYCPNCDFVDEGPSPSLRSGDSCPKCRGAYLTEREM